MNLSELLQWLKSEGAPDDVVRSLESKIERRRLRIERHEHQVKEWIERQKKKEKDDKDDRRNNDNMWLVLMLILLLEDDTDDDEFSLNDLLPDQRGSLMKPRW